ncbi:O-antigen ligase family protein [Lolliginicoccus suaedae]|uniref:O-antigen ligase family protein n=1 Tax=Lolliginicoccus suaedae TaxID=2605429 RepID=UPI0011ED7DE0|nr:hypothetical protein [Lolliginicoccus suaedae]
MPERILAAPPIKDPGKRRPRRIIGLLANVPILGMGTPLAVIPVTVLALMQTRLPRHRLARMCIFAAVIGFVALASSAVWHDTRFPIVALQHFLVFAVMVVGLSGIVRTSDEAVHLLAWLSLGTVAYYVIIGNARTAESIESLWKFGIAFPATMLVLYVLRRLNVSRYAVTFALVGFGIYGMYLNSRAYALICFGVALFDFLRSSRKGLTRTRVWVGVLGLLGFGTIMPSLILSGVFGESVRLKTLAQSDGGGFALLDGRTEPPLAIAAILERPILGWGSEQALTWNTIYAGVRLAEYLGMSSPDDYMKYWIRPGGRISIHSIFFESWIQGGVLAVLFPIALLVTLALGFIRMRGQYSIVVMLVCAQSFWDILFSPWVANKSIYLAVIVLAVTLPLTPEKDDKPEPAPAHRAARLSRLQRSASPAESAATEGSVEPERSG